MKIGHSGFEANMGAATSDAQASDRSSPHRGQHRYRLMHHSIVQHERDGWVAVALSVSMYISSLAFLILSKVFPGLPFGIVAIAAFVSGTSMVPMAWHSFQKAHRMTEAL